MRGLKNMDTPHPEGISVVSQLRKAARRAEGRDSRRPAGIRVEGQNKWFTVIQNAPKKD
jgi:hypothetical protein